MTSHFDETNKFVSNHWNNRNIFNVIGTSTQCSTSGARITPGGCANQGGNLPPEQQGSCQGGGLNQQPNTNPAGQAPPGQNR